MSSISGSSPILPWHQWLNLRETHLKRHCMLRATVLVYAKKITFCISKTYFFYFILIFLQNTLISFSIIHIYSNKIFISLTLSPLSLTQHNPHSHHHQPPSLSRSTPPKASGGNGERHSTRNPLIKPIQPENNEKQRKKERSVAVAIDGS